MKEYDVCIPISGKIWVTVEAETQQEAIEKALSSEQICRDNLEEWEAHTKIVQGNIFYGMQNEAFAVPHE